MPFNDYYVGAPPLTPLSTWTLIVPPLLGLLAPWAGVIWGDWPWSAALLVGIALALFGLLIDYWIVLRKGRQPFPSSQAPLPRVLKSLYLQQAFARFAAAHQDDDPKALGAAFRAFLKDNDPADEIQPTQAPGIVRSFPPKAAA